VLTKVSLHANPSSSLANTVFSSKRTTSPALYGSAVRTHKKAPLENGAIGHKRQGKAGNGSGDATESVLEGIRQKRDSAKENKPRK